MTRLVHHLALASDWEAALAAGAYRISTRGRTLAEEGFIHACFADQVDGVARRYYADVAEPMLLLAVDVRLVGCEVRLEVPPGAPDAFPHLYGPIPIGAVVAATPYRTAPPTASWARLHHAHLFCADLDATVAWWRRWFGARVVADEVLLGSRNVMVAIGDGRLNLYDQPPPDAAAGGGRSAVHHLGVQVRDVAALEAALRQAGVPLRRGARDGEGFRYLMVAAPDGVLVEAFEAVEGSMPRGTVPWFSWA
ncbi:MAG: DUF952 domain-containing protein [Acidimicrobiales bacterium]